MFQVIYRVVLIYFVVLIVVRVMGKREIGQFSPFDFVVAIIIAELAAIPMESSGIPLWKAVMPMFILAFLEVALSYMALHSSLLRKFLDGKPQVVIKNGHISKGELRKARYNLDDLLAQLREKGIANVYDVELGILETSGKLSVVPKPQKRPITPEDIGLPTKYEGLPTVLIMDGIIQKPNLKELGVDELWLKNHLAKFNMGTKDIFLAIIDTSGKLYITKQNNHA